MGLCILHFVLGGNTPNQNGRSTDLRLFCISSSRARSCVRLAHFTIILRATTLPVAFQVARLTHPKAPEPSSSWISKNFPINCTPIIQYRRVRQRCRGNKVRIYNTVTSQGSFGVEITRVVAERKQPLRLHVGSLHRVRLVHVTNSGRRGFLRTSRHPT